MKGIWFYQKKNYKCDVLSKMSVNFFERRKLISMTWKIFKINVEIFTNVIHLLRSIICKNNFSCELCLHNIMHESNDQNATLADLAKWFDFDGKIASYRREVT